MGTYNIYKTTLKIVGNISKFEGCLSAQSAIQAVSLPGPEISVAKSFVVQPGRRCILLQFYFTNKTFTVYMLQDHCYNLGPSDTVRSVVKAGELSDNHSMAVSIINGNRSNSHRTLRVVTELQMI